MLVGMGVGLWSLASGVPGLAGTLVGLLLTRCLVGVGEAAYGPVAPAIIADLYPTRMRGRMLAWFYMAIPVGSALGYVLGGFVAGSGIGAWGAGLIGVRTESWRWAFYLVVVPGLLLALWSIAMPDRRRAAVGLAGATPGRAVPWRSYLI